MLRLFFCLLFLFCTSVVCSGLAFAKSPPTPPPIDSITTDEAQHQLVIYGQFLFTPGLKVFVDSVEFAIDSVSATEIRSTIPDSGKGSCGWVWVTANGIATNAKLLSYWSFYNHYQFEHIYSDGGRETVYSWDTIFLRCDLLSRRNHPNPFSVEPIGLSWYLQFADGNDGNRGYKYMGPRYDYKGVPTAKISFSPGDTSILDNQANRILAVNSGGDILAYNHDGNCGVGTAVLCDHGGPLAPVRFPAIQSAAVLATPMSEITTHLLEVTQDALILNASPPEEYLYEIVNLLGQSVLQGKLVAAARSTIPVSSLTAGSYILRLSNGRGVHSMKFIKR